MEVHCQLILRSAISDEKVDVPCLYCTPLNISLSAVLTQTDWGRGSEEEFFRLWGTMPIRADISGEAEM